MKLLTYLIQGEERIGILTSRREPRERLDSAENGIPMRSVNGADPVVIDIHRAVVVLKGQHDIGRFWWISGWEGPWGVWTAPRDMIDIARFGKAAVDALRDLEDAFWGCARSADAAWTETALVDPSDVTWLPPIPEPPAFFFFHNNNSVAMNFQFPDIGRRLIPHTRTRPLTSVAGTGDLIPASADGFIKEDVEFGFVSGPPARLVSRENIMNYVFGYTVCWDGSRPDYAALYKAKCSDPRPDQKRASANCSKAMDLHGVFGPVIVTTDEIGNPHDLLQFLYVNGRQRGRSYTGAYLDSVPDTLHFFTRIMTVQPGTLFAMGAAGYDGFPVVADFRRPGDNILKIETERIGALENRIVYIDEPEGKELGSGSPYLWRRNRLGLAAASALDLKPGDIPKTTKHFWTTTCNSGDLPRDSIPAPYLLPRSSLASSGTPIELPPNGGTMDVAVQLAGVVGPEPLFGIPPDEVLSRILGFAVIVGVRDHRILELGEKDPVDGSSVFAYYMASFGDGYHNVGTVVPTDMNSISNAEIKLAVNGLEVAAGNVADYPCGLETLVEWITLGITLLPGDIVSLGDSQAVARLEWRPGGEKEIKVKAEIAGLPALDTILIDERDPDFPDWKGLPI